MKVIVVERIIELSKKMDEVHSQFIGASEGKLAPLIWVVRKPKLWYVTVAQLLTIFGK